MGIASLRQSKSWEKYLNFLNWDVVATTSGIKIALMKTFLGTVSKIQRPKPFNDKDLDEIEEICKKRKCMFIKIEPGHGQDESILTKRGYQESRFPLSPPSTMHIELNESEQELWKRVSKSGKYSVKRAGREGARTEFIEYPSKKDIEEFYKMAKETSKRGKFYIQPVKDLLKKREIFKKNCFIGKVFDRDGNLVGSKLFFGNKNTVTFMYGGTSALGRKGKAGYELMWQSIIYFKKLGFQFLDLEGVDDDRFPTFTKNWGGFSYFKEKFGGKVLRLPPPYIKYTSPILKFLSRFQELPL